MYSSSFILNRNGIVPGDLNSSVLFIDIHTLVFINTLIRDIVSVKTVARSCITLPFRAKGTSKFSLNVVPERTLDRGGNLTHTASVTPPTEPTPAQRSRKVFGKLFRRLNNILLVLSAPRYCSLEKGLESTFRILWHYRNSAGSQRYLGTSRKTDCMHMRCASLRAGANLAAHSGPTW